MVVEHGEGAVPTVAVSYFHRAYDGGAPELDFGSPVNSLLVLASADVKGFRSNTNAMFNELTQGSVRRAQYGQSLSVSHAIAGKFSLSGEIWHFTQPFLGEMRWGICGAGLHSKKNAPYSTRVSITG